jgi:hypothetical protein
MNALIVCWLLAAADAGASVVVASPTVVEVSSSFSAVASSTSAVAVSSAAGKVDAGKPAKQAPEIPAPTDSEVPGLIDQLIVALKNHNYLLAAITFALLVLWAAKKLSKQPPKNAPVATVTPAANEIVPPAKPSDPEKK